MYELLFSPPLYSPSPPTHSPLNTCFFFQPPSFFFPDKKEEEEEEEEQVLLDEDDDDDDDDDDEGEDEMEDLGGGIISVGDEDDNGNDEDDEGEGELNEADEDEGKLVSLGVKGFYKIRKKRKKKRSNVDIYSHSCRRWSRRSIRSKRQGQGSSRK